MATPILLPPNRRSCEESLASRAWASAHARRPSNLFQLLGDLLPLLDAHSPRPLYGRVARRAMASGDAQAMLDAIKMVCTELDYCRTERAKFHAYATRLSTQAA